jgi:hypothetical protein
MSTTVTPRAASPAPISGDTQKVVVVETNSGYAADPGDPGTDTVVAVVCGGGGNLGRSCRVTDAGGSAERVAAGLQRRT